MPFLLLIILSITIPAEVIDGIVKDLCRDFTGGDMKAVNYKLYQQIRNYIKVSVRRNGKQDFDFVKLIDFDTPENNTFTAVSQMWIEGRFNWRRPDVIIFVNGLPLVFMELKNSDVKVEEAYNRNLKSYLKDVPNLFEWFSKKARTTTGNLQEAVLNAMINIAKNPDKKSGILRTVNAPWLKKIKDTALMLANGEEYYAKEIAENYEKIQRELANTKVTTC